MPGILTLIALAAFVLVLVSAAGKCPLWVPVFLLSFLELVGRLANN